MNDIVLGPRLQKNLDKKLQKYPDTSVLTMKFIPHFEGKTYYRFELNKHAIEELGFSWDSENPDETRNQISLGGDLSTGRRFIFENTNKRVVETDVRNVAKQSHSFSDKPFYVDLSKQYNLDTTKDQEFTLTKENVNYGEHSFDVFVLTPMNLYTNPLDEMSVEADNDDTTTTTVVTTVINETDENTSSEPMDSPEVL